MIKKENVGFLSESIMNEMKKDFKSNISFKISKDNLKIPIINNTAIHSTYYPLKDAERIEFSKNQKELCIAIGFGAGYHLTKIASYNKMILAIPVDMCLLKEVLKEVDLTLWFKDNNLKIINHDELLIYFDLYRFNSYSIIIHPILEKLYNAKVLEIIKSISNKIRPLMLEVNTQKKFGKIWLNNIFKNIIHFFVNHFNYRALIINKKPILIVGAGPSLIHNIEKIKNSRNELFIASTDTGLKILGKYEIIPDAVFSFDAQYYSYFHFTGIKADYRLFTDFTSSLRLGNKQTLLFNNHPLIHVFKNNGFKPIMLLSDTRNIGGALIDFFLRHFPDYPVVTAGVDYGYYKNYSYSRYSYLDEYKLNNSNYYNTENNIDCLLFYKDIFIKQIGDWKTTRLLEKYEKLSPINENVFTLSDSPFSGYKRIDSFNEVVEKAKKLDVIEIDFFKPKINKKEFFSIFYNYIEENPDKLTSYFLSINKHPNFNEIKAVISYLKSKYDNI